MPNRLAEQHVAVLTFPFGTHAAPLLTLVQRLSKAAPEVTFSFLGTAGSNSSLLSSVSETPQNVKFYDVPDGVPEGYVFLGKPQEGINLFLNEARGSFEEGVEKAEKDVGRKVSCVISDAFLWFSCEMAQEKGVPWVAFWTAGSAALSAHLHTDLIRNAVGLDGIGERKDELLTCVPGLTKINLGDLPSGILFGDLDSPFSIMLHKMGQTLPRANAVAINSFEDLDPQATKDLITKLAKYLNVGPFNLVSPPPSSSNSNVQDSLQWLDQQKQGSVAYIGFGTVVALPPHELKALAEALEASKTPFLWSLKENMRCNLPEGFLERTGDFGKVVPWAPQVQVLAHSATGVFITHCGWNSVLESIAAGVPIIGRPFLGDQHLNVAMAEKFWQIGVKIDGGVFTKTGAMQALELVLSNGGMKLKKQIGIFREQALQAVEPNGSSTRNFATLQDMIRSWKS